MKRFQNADVARVFAAYPAPVRKAMHELRQLIFATAAKTAGVGALEETLKWGEPSYVTSQTRSGSTVRIGWKKARPDEYAMYFHCQTDLVERFRARFPRSFTYDGNRALVFAIGAPIARGALADCVTAALTYHSRKKRGRGAVPPVAAPR